MKTIRLFSRIITGLVFIFSGFVKAVDPLGSAYKFSDYFQAFHLDFLKLFGLPLAFLLFTAEFITGVSIITGLRQKTGIYGALILILIFTPLTFVLALTNPVSDCGCFGDAIHLTNWETFGKNIILLIMILILFSGRKAVRNVLITSAEWIILITVSIAFILFSFYNVKYLPVIDFLPYKTGAIIKEKMKVPEGAQSDQYAVTFIYEKEGLKKEFTLNNYPASDTTWKFVEQKSKLIKKGYVPPIHDFSIVTAMNEDITDVVLSDTSYSLLMVTKKLGEAKAKYLSDGFELGRSCVASGISFYILTASGEEDIKKYENGLKFCNTDETTLKTMLRSNPGYMLIKEGKIVGKWSWAELGELRNLLNIKPNISF
jgi:hypothetical protein